MRVLRLIGVVAGGIAVLGALGFGLVAAWAVSGSPAAPRPPVVRTDPPAGLGGDLAPRLEVEIGPLTPGSLDLDVTVRNPNARSVHGVRVVVEVEGGTCGWPGGGFPSPLGLAPAEVTNRTCGLVLDAAVASTVVGVVVDVGGHRVAASSVVIDHAAPTTAVDPRSMVEGPAAPAGRLGGAPAGPTPVAPAPADQTPGATSPSCPRVVDGLEPAPARALAELGPALTHRARLLDTGGCPGWSALSELEAVRLDSPELCPAWDVHLDGSSRPVARLSGPQLAGCPVAALEVEVGDRSADLAARVATMVAWTVAGPGARAADLHRAAATGTGLGCPGTGTGGGAALGQAYEQTTEGGRVYRVTVRTC